MQGTQGLLNFSNLKMITTTTTTRSLLKKKKLVAVGFNEGFCGSSCEHMSKLPRKWTLPQFSQLMEQEKHNSTNHTHHCSFSPKGWLLDKYVFPKELRTLATFRLFQEIKIKKKLQCFQIFLWNWYNPNIKRTEKGTHTNVICISRYKEKWHSRGAGAALRGQQEQPESAATFHTVQNWFTIQQLFWYALVDCLPNVGISSFILLICTLPCFQFINISMEDWKGTLQITQQEL